MIGEMTPWFSIDSDGQPTRPGWYNTRYNGDREDSADMTYWDGKHWRYEEDAGSQTAFGNWDTEGEYWRGLTAPANENNED